MSPAAQDATTAAPAAPDASRLCLACGICCQGALHRWARITDDEVETVERLGLAVSRSEKGAVFALPCHLHQEGRCTVYMERPSPCSSYQCKLLRRYLAGESTWEESMRRVDLAKDLLARLRRRIGPEHLRSLEPAQLGAVVADRELLMDAVAFSTLCKNHFLNRAQPVETLGP